MQNKGTIVRIVLVALMTYALLHFAAARAQLEQTGSFDTGDKWITVTVPISEFVYNADGTKGIVPLSSADDFATFVLWPWDGGVKGTECTPIFRIDNIRAVPYK